MIEKIKYSEAVKDTQEHIITGPKGWEYLGRNNGKNVYWLPTQKVVEKFTNTIGDKWNCTKSDRISFDLRCTNIVIDGRYIMARGGLCPSGVRLFELIDEVQDD